jgi:hypothetical protein
MIALPGIALPAAVGFVERAEFPERACAAQVQAETSPATKLLHHDGTTFLGREIISPPRKRPSSR